ncbi:MAG: dihydroorotate dehydrogenase [Herpetosiphonaceae bacterium]|nr:dihydroorotate dehydrogenase [Herpetosiphonaceae bacterium]
MIDLAPHNPYSVPLRSPVLVATGCAMRELDVSQVGAVLTRTVTVHTRHLPPPCWAATPAGLLLSHRPTISVRTLLRDDARRWSRSTAPVWASVLGNGDELLETVSRLAGVEGLAGLVLEIEGLFSGRVVHAIRTRTLLPLLVTLPLVPDAAPLAQELVAAGADALCVAAAPHAAMLQDGSVLAGGLYGPAVMPLVLHQLSLVRSVVEVPLVAQGGISDLAMARDYLAAGASALLVDAARWGEPFVAQRLAAQLQA